LRIRDIIKQHKSIEMLDAVNILALALSTSKEGVFMGLDREVDEATHLRIKSLLAERERGMPFAYIARNKEFYSENFYVDQGVLIPRPETEILVEEALGLLARNPEMNSILDMGTGSGAIGLILAKTTGKRVVCADISPGALRVAQRNGAFLGVLGNTRFVCADLFTAMGDVRFDMILANLPYVASEEWENLMSDVKDYEPRTALDGGQGGVGIYRRFLEGLPQHLKENGYVLCEIGGCEQANKMRDMFRAIDLTVVVKKDFSGIERVLIGSWTSLS
jgi:release factor glutamine methyltransferase